LLDIIKDLKENGVTAKEVEVAKGNCKGGSLMDLQSVDTLAKYNGVATVLKKDTVAFNDVYTKHIAPITYQQVNRIIHKYMIYSNLVVGIVHDHAIPKKKIESMCKQYID
jgi:predicted Zn-dependent peptidase